MSRTFECQHCQRNVYESVLSETGGYCAYCDELMRPPTEVLQQWKAVREGTRGEWNDVEAAIKDYSLNALYEFLKDENGILVNRINLLNRTTDAKVKPYMNPEEIKV